MSDPAARLASDADLFGDAERERYRRDGFLVCRDLFSREERQIWEQRFLAIVAGRVAAADGMLVMRDVMVAKGAVSPDDPVAGIAKIQDFHADPVLFEHYCQSSRLLDRVQSLIGSADIKSIHTMLINKPPHVDGRHPLHQDLLYFPFRPADSIVASWTALDPANRANGCLVVVPGSHRGDLRRHENPDWEWLNLGYFGATGVDAETERVHLEMQPGDTVFFHPLLLHGSGRNRSDGFRRAISCHYADARCRFLPGAEALGQRRPYLSVRGQTFEGCI